MMSNFTFLNGVLVRWKSGAYCNEGHPTEASSPSPVGFLVTTSHFSGVVTMIWVSAISARVICISPEFDVKITQTFQLNFEVYLPVSSRTWIDSHASLRPSLRTISEAKAFIGALENNQFKRASHHQRKGRPTHK